MRLWQLLSLAGRCYRCLCEGDRDGTCPTYNMSRVGDDSLSLFLVSCLWVFDISVEFCVENEYTYSCGFCKVCCVA